MSIQESIYRSLGLSMTRFSDVVRFINTNHPDRRDGLLKSNFDDLKEEESIFHNSLHDYYQIRPYDDELQENYWDDLCLADFVSRHNIEYKPKVNSKRKLIKLNDGKSFISRRQRPCVIRYFLKYENEEEYFRALCILFLSFRNESIDIHSHDVKELYYANQDKIEGNRSRFEKHKTLIDAIEDVETKDDKADDLEEDISPYIEDETTTEKEIEDFEKSLKADAKKMISNFNEGSLEVDEETHRRNTEYL